MRTDLLGRYTLVQEGGSVRIDLKRGHRVLSTCPDGGEYDGITSIGFGDCGCDLVVSENRKGLVCGYSELSFGRTDGAAVAIADMGSGVCRAGQGCPSEGGEVSLILLLGPSFSVSSMARAGVTSAEAITAAIQDLGLRDSVGRPGSGVRDLRMAIVSDTSSEIRLHGTGKHSKMGEIIGRTVREAVMGSAVANGVPSPDRDIIFTRLALSGYTDERIAREFPAVSGRIREIRDGLRGDERMRAGFSSLMHLCDEIGWGLIPEKAGREVGCGIVRTLFGRCSDRGGDLIDVFAATLFDGS